MALKLREPRATPGVFESIMRLPLRTLFVPLLANLALVTSACAAEHRPAPKSAPDSAPKKTPAKDDLTSGGQHSGGPKGWGCYRITNVDPALPRVLLIGDSIANGYHAAVAKSLKGKANLDLYITPLHVAAPDYQPKLSAALKYGPYAVIHFNESGLHAWTPGRVPEGQYGKYFAEAVAVLRADAPKARLIWASNTPVTVQGKPGVPDKVVGQTVIDMNTAARAVAEKEGLAIDDLHTLMADKLNLAAGDRWHWSGKGVAVQAEAVTASVLAELAKCPAPEAPATPGDNPSTTPSKKAPGK